MLPAGTVGHVERGSWQVPAVFDLVRRLGPVDWADLEQTLNLGVGMVAVLTPDAAARAVATAQAAGIGAWELGTVARLTDQDEDVVTGTKGMRGGAVRLHGSYRV